MKLEKSYLRLTSVSALDPYLYHSYTSQEPSPADIRPLNILKKTLELLKEKWKNDHNYAYAVDQFKSMRQDLTVSASLSNKSELTKSLRFNGSRMISQ